MWSEGIPAQTHVKTDPNINKQRNRNHNNGQEVATKEKGRKKNDPF